MFLFLITGIYLYRIYTYFYSFLGQNQLASPISETTIMVGNQSGSRIIKYVALGDSLTEGVGVSDIKSSYPYLIAQKLSGKFNVKLVNLAHGGDTSSDVLANQLAQAIAQKPDLITILIGINDIHNLKSLTEFENNYTQIMTNLKKSGAIIYMLSIPYLGSDKIVFFPYNFILDFQTRQFNLIVKKVADKFNVHYIDIYSVQKTDGFYSQDEFHPSKKGYNEWMKVMNAIFSR